MSREKIREIIQRFMPQTMDRGTTNMSLTSTDLLQPKKLSLHEGLYHIYTQLSISGKLTSQSILSYQRI